MQRQQRINMPWAASISMTSRPGICSQPALPIHARAWTKASGRDRAARGQRGADRSAKAAATRRCSSVGRESGSGTIRYRPCSRPWFSTSSSVSPGRLALPHLSPGHHLAVVLQPGGLAEPGYPVLETART